MSLEHDFDRQMTRFTVLMGIQVVWLAVPHRSYYEGFPAAALLVVIPWRLWRRGLPAYRCSVALEVLTLVWVVPVAAISAFPSVVVVLLVTACSQVCAWRCSDRVRFATDRHAASTV